MKVLCINNGPITSDWGKNSAPELHEGELYSVENEYDEGYVLIEVKPKNAKGYLKCRFIPVSDTETKTEKYERLDHIHQPA